MAQAAVAAWSGIANGRIPTAMMLSIGSGQVMEPHAARQLLAALADMSAHGFTVPVVEGYRDYATQVQLRNLYLSGKGNVAAVPGTSNHGTGSAVDLGGGMDSWDSQAQDYWQYIEGYYGYSSAQGRVDGEPWHKVCVQWLDNISNILDGGFLMALSDSQQSDVYAWLKGLAFGDFPKAKDASGQNTGGTLLDYLGWIDNHVNILVDAVTRKNADGSPAGHDLIQAVNNSVVGLYAVVKAATPAGAAITDAQVQQIADSLKQGLGADVATELSKRLAS